MMGTRKHRSSGSADQPEQQARPVERDYVAEVQNRVAQLTGAADQATGATPDTPLRGKRRQQVEREMASLRAQALEARRLAERIDNLSREAPRPKGRRVMTEPVTAKPDAVAHTGRTDAETPRSGTSQLSFNPLHPSMELPPEQLIRLLGLQTKKIRKGRKSAGQTREHTVGTTGGAGDIDAIQDSSRSEPFIPPLPRASRAGARDRQPKRSGILLPATVIGLLMGAAVAGYLFTSKPSIGTQVPAAAPAGPGGSSQMPAEPAAVSKPVQPEPIRTTQAPAKPPAGATQQASPLSDQYTGETPDPARQSAITAELEKLRTEAEQRFAQQMSRIEASRELEALSPGRIQDEAHPLPTVTPAGELTTPNASQVFEEPRDDRVPAPIPLPPSDISGAALSSPPAAANAAIPYEEDVTGEREAQAEPPRDETP